MRSFTVILMLVLWNAMPIAAQAQKVRPTKSVTQKLNVPVSDDKSEHGVSIVRALLKQQAFKPLGSVLKLDRSRSSGDLRKANEHLVVHAAIRGRHINRLIGPERYSAKQIGPIVRLDSEIQGQFISAFGAAYSVGYLTNEAEDYQRYKVVFRHDLKSEIYTIRYYHSPKNSRVGLWSNYATLVYRDTKRPSNRTLTDTERCNYMTCKGKTPRDSWDQIKTVPFGYVPIVSGEQKVFERSELIRLLSHKWMTQDFFRAE